LLKEEKKKEQSEHTNRLKTDDDAYNTIEDQIFKKMQDYSSSKIEIEVRIQKLQN